MTSMLRLMCTLFNFTAQIRPSVNVSIKFCRSVWIRNGNRLGGDPKKRTRVLANEKVRWSLHNVRLRLAKKKNYCQFFTRFGKCNKDDGKCPYIHNPSKIAVCTKFVSRLCANPDCKLIHKVQLLNHCHRNCIFGVHKRSLTG